MFSVTILLVLFAICSVFIGAAELSMLLFLGSVVFLLHAAEIDISTNVFWALLFVSSAPLLAAYGAGLLLNEALVYRSQQLRKSIAIVAVCLSGAVMLSSSAWLSSFTSVVMLAQNGSLRSIVSIVVQCVSAISFCAAAVALVAMILSSLIECIGTWIVDATRARFQFPWAFVRSGVIILCLSMSASIIEGLFQTELSPSNIIKLKK